MKKRFLAVAILLNLVLIAGCAENTTTQNDYMEIPINESSKIEENIQATSNLDNTEMVKETETMKQYSSDTDTVSIGGKEYKIFSSSNADAALTELYSDVVEFNNSGSATVVVNGVVKDISYDYIEHVPLSIITLEVLECYEGELDGDEIIIYEDGGYVPLPLLADDLEAHIDLNMTKKQMDEYVVDMTFMNAKHAQVGDKMIAYLVANKESWREGSYRYVSSVFGRYLENGDVYERTEHDVSDVDNRSRGVNDFEISIPKQKMEELLQEKN